MTLFTSWRAAILATVVVFMLKVLVVSSFLQLIPFSMNSSPSSNLTLDFATAVLFFFFRFVWLDKSVSFDRSSVCLVSFLKLVQSRSFADDNVLSSVIDSLCQYSINTSSIPITPDHNSCYSFAQVSSESSPVVHGESDLVSSQRNPSPRAVKSNWCLGSADLPRPGFLADEIYAVEQFTCCTYSITGEPSSVLVSSNNSLAVLTASPVSQVLY
jgi:hypothetical protein